MRRTAVRLVMPVVGVLSLAAYAAASPVVYRALSVVWASRPSALTTVPLPVGLTIAIGYTPYRAGSRRLLDDRRTEPLRREQTPELSDRFEDRCSRAGFAPPPLYVADPGEPNAFAIGDTDSGTVVDDSLFALVTKAEVLAVLANELGHLESRDSLVQVISFTAVGTAVELLTGAPAGDAEPTPC